MAFLVNRNPAARIECLHALCRYINTNYGTTRTFKLKDVKYDRTKDNVHNYCTLLHSSLGLKFCRYKQSALDDSGCYLTNGVNVDTTKSKEVSNTINSLHALGFVKRDNRTCILTEEGQRFATTEYDSLQMLSIIRKAVSNYGPIRGLLSQIMDKREFSSKDIVVGYPNTEEYIYFNNQKTLLSVGSKQDANTRTKSCLLAWLTTAGIVFPKKLGNYVEKGLPQTIYRDFLNNERRQDERYASLKNCIEEVLKFSLVQKPLDYNNLTKLTSALRENDSKNTREATLEFEGRIKNRRFAIIYLLNEAFKNKTQLRFLDILSLYKANPNFFLISNDNVENIILSELDIATTCGIPFSVIEKNDEIFLIPYNGINVDELSLGAPHGLLNLLKTYFINE